MIFYPAWPLLTSFTKGTLGYSSRQELALDVEAATALQKGRIDKIAAMPIKDIIKDKDLSQFATEGGAAAFKINCSTCHGSGAAGGPGFPNLNDNDWLWGGDLDAIYLSIAHGVRSTGSNSGAETRTSEMPAFKEILKPDEITQLAAFLVSLTGKSAKAAMVAQGKQLFADNCAVCHGDEAKGNREFGAPNLTDAIWLKGEGEVAVASQIANPKHGMMPAWLPRLGDSTVKQLAIYVHSLGGGE